MPLLEGGMTTRRSGFRLFIPTLPPPGGGGDFVGMTLPTLFAPVFPIKFGEALEFTNPFPTGLFPAPFGTVRSVVLNIPPALPVLGGLCGAPGDTFLCSVAGGGDSMLDSANVELAAKDGDTSELPGLVYDKALGLVTGTVTDIEKF